MDDRALSRRPARAIRRPPIAWRSVAAGLVAGAGLFGLYVGVVAIAQGPPHALEQLATDWPAVVLVTIGLATQVALFTELRAIDRTHRDAAALTGIGAGTSTAAMLACCAHHLVDLLPLIGVSAAASFLGAYRTPLLVAGLGLNAIGVLVIATRLREARRACLVLAGSTAGPAETAPAH